MRGLLLQAATLSMSFEEFYAGLLFPALASFPILGRLATIALTVPVTSVNCERGISTYNAVKTSGRASLKVSAVETLVTLNLEAPNVHAFPYEDAFKVWTLQKRHTGYRVYGEGGGFIRCKVSGSRVIRSSSSCSSVHVSRHIWTCGLEHTSLSHI